MAKYVPRYILSKKSEFMEKAVVTTNRPKHWIVNLYHRTRSVLVAYMRRKYENRKHD